MREFQTVVSLVDGGRDEAAAIAALDQPALSYAGLRALTGRTIDRLNTLGIGRNDRVAIVLGNGPHMAAAFVTIAAGATTAPLNPAYRADEFEFYLNDLQAKTLLVERGVDSPARTVAQKLGVPIVELCPDPASGAGAFTLEPLSGLGERAASAGAAEADDIALILHTSGTTSRPKMVPLTQRNITASARHIMTTLQLSPDDTCLNVMPLFHIHGLMAAVLSSLAAGAQVWCSPGFNPLKFFGWLDEVRPSWYTAVPTMHQTILARVQRNPEVDRAQPASADPILIGVAAFGRHGAAGRAVSRAGHRELRHDRGVASDGLQSRCRRGSGSRDRSAWPPDQKWPSWTSRARCCRRDRWAKS